MGKRRAFIDGLKVLIHWPAKLDTTKYTHILTRARMAKESAYMDGGLIRGSRLASQSKPEVAMCPILSQANGLQG